MDPISFCFKLLCFISNLNTIKKEETNRSEYSNLNYRSNKCIKVPQTRSKSKSKVANKEIMDQGSSVSSYKNQVNQDHISKLNEENENLNKKIFKNQKILK